MSFTPFPDFADDVYIVRIIVGRLHNTYVGWHGE